MGKSSHRGNGTPNGGGGKTAKAAGAGAVALTTIIGVPTGLIFLPDWLIEKLANGLFGWLPEEYRETALTMSSSSCCCCCSCIIIIVVVLALRNRN